MTRQRNAFWVEGDLEDTESEGEKPRPMISNPRFAANSDAAQVPVGSSSSDVGGAWDTYNAGRR